MTAIQRILAVDDNPTNLAIISEILEDDYELRTAASGEEALEVAQTFSPDIILLDIMMPGIDGYETCRQIRSHSELKNSKVIMVSAKAMVSERIKGYEAGADDYITKPFEDEELLAKIRVHLRLKNAEEVDQLKGDVLTLLAHEIRTPLNGLIGSAEALISYEDIDKAEMKELSKIVLDSAKSIQHLFENIVRLCHFHSGNTALETVPVDMAEILKQAVEAVNEIATEKSLRLDCRCEPNAMVKIDPTVFPPVLKVLLENAVKFSPSDETVEIALKNQENKVVITISNRGQGISAKALPKVFDAFCSDDLDHHSKGAKLSLAIAYQIVKQHRGKISVVSEENQETTFTIELPRLTSKVTSREQEMVTASSQ